MNILILAPQWPDPPMQGAAIRNLQIVRYLARKHTVSLLTFESPSAQDSQQLYDLASICRHAETLPVPSRTSRGRLLKLFTSAKPDMAWRLDSDAMSERVEELCAEEQFDAIHVEGIEMAPYGLLALRLLPNARMIYDAHNAEYLLQRRAFTTDFKQFRRLPRAIYSFIQWNRLRRFERQLLHMSKWVFAVSPADVSALTSLYPLGKNRVLLLPNGVDLDYWAPNVIPPADREVGSEALVFDGTMDFRPNVDAVLWFAKDVWPLIRAERPHVRFYIVGRTPAPEVLALSEDPGIIVTGMVDDTRPWVAGCEVYVVPMRMGGGVRLKVLQAMSMERAIVSTPMGAEGIAVRPGKDMLLTFSSKGFANAVLLLLSDHRRRRALGVSARELVSSQYSWDSLLPTLDEAYPDGK
ncbi:MAG: glycosyltransferase family 4 protein [Chloroflexia bacterium]